MPRWQPASFSGRRRPADRAIVVTLDTWVTGWRPRDLSTSNFPQLRGRCLKTYFSDPVFRSRLQKPPEEDPGTAILTWALMFGRPLAWDDLAWLRSLTTLPIVLKGICHPGDARRAVDEGIDGIYVSTHEGRQANGGLAAIDCLADVAEAVPDVPVLFDSGIRSGSDVVKALALGATAVGIGRSTDEAGPGTEQGLREIPAARQLGEQAVEFARQQRDDRLLSDSLMVLSSTYYFAGEPQRGFPLGEESVQYARRLGDDALLGPATGEEGQIAARSRWYQVPGLPPRSAGSAGPAGTNPALASTF